MRFVRRTEVVLSRDIPTHMMAGMPMVRMVGGGSALMVDRW